MHGDVATTTVTTTAPAGVCKSWCASDGKKWTQKCSWPQACGGCSQCSGACMGMFCDAVANDVALTHHSHTYHTQTHHSHTYHALTHIPHTHITLTHIAHAHTFHILNNFSHTYRVYGILKTSITVIAIIHVLNISKSI